VLGAQPGQDVEETRGDRAARRRIERGLTGRTELARLPLVVGDDREAVLGSLGDRRRALIPRFREALRRVVEPALCQRDRTKTEAAEIAHAFALRHRELAGGVGGPTGGQEGSAERGLRAAEERRERRPGPPGAPPPLR